MRQGHIDQMRGQWNLNTFSTPTELDDDALVRVLAQVENALFLGSLLLLMTASSTAPGLIASRAATTAADRGAI